MLYFRSYSILVGRPQFGSRPNLYKTTATTRGGGRSRLQGPGLGEAGGGVSRGRMTGGVTLSEWRSRCHEAPNVFPLTDKLSKTRKIVRPRMKTELGSRVGRAAKHGAGAEGGRGAGAAADSTTESDDPGNTRTIIKLVFQRSMFRDQQTKVTNLSEETRNKFRQQGGSRRGRGL